MSLSTGRTPESAGAIEENLLRYLESRTTTLPPSRHHDAEGFSQLYSPRR